MADRPILFSAPMVRALLAGTKTQTRRVLKNVTPDVWCGEERWRFGGKNSAEIYLSEGDLMERAPASQYMPFHVGDRLWVRESWWHVCAGDGPTISAPGDSLGRDGAFFRADYPDYPPCPHYRARVSIHMPRWASRLTLTVTDVRVERLQDISEEDARDEGVERIKFPEHGDWGWPQRKFAELWTSINGPTSWEANPWIVAVSFDVRKGNIDG